MEGKRYHEDSFQQRHFHGIIKPKKQSPKRRNPGPKPAHHPALPAKLNFAWQNMPPAEKKDEDDGKLVEIHWFLPMRCLKNVVAFCSSKLKDMLIVFAEDYGLVLRFLWGYVAYFSFADGFWFVIQDQSKFMSSRVWTRLMLSRRLEFSMILK